MPAFPDLWQLEGEGCAGQAHGQCPLQVPCWWCGVRGPLLCQVSPPFLQMPETPHEWGFSGLSALPPVKG